MCSFVITFKNFQVSVIYLPFCYMFYILASSPLSPSDTFLINLFHKPDAVSAGIFPKLINFCPYFYFFHDVSLYLFHCCFSKLLSQIISM